MGSLWKRLDSRIGYRSDYVNVFEDEVELPDKTIIKYTRVILPDFVTIVPVVSDQFVMIYNYRYPVNEWSLELPSGIIDQGEEPEQTALRELEEETGYFADRLSRLGWYYPMSDRSLQKAHIFLAEHLKRGKKRRDKTEQQESCLMPRNKVYSALFEGLIKDSATIVALAMVPPQFSFHGNAVVE